MTAVPHGFGASFRDSVAEATDHAREVAAVVLAHAVYNHVERPAGILTDPSGGG